MSTTSLGLTGSSNAITINNTNGFVGIGTTTPATALQVAGTVTATGYAGLPVATTSAAGVVTVDGTTITATNGIISTTNNYQYFTAPNNSKTFNLAFSNIGENFITINYTNLTTLSGGTTIYLQVAYGSTPTWVTPDLYEVFVQNGAYGTIDFTKSNGIFLTNASQVNNFSNSGAIRLAKTSTNTYGITGEGKTDAYSISIAGAMTTVGKITSLRLYADNSNFQTGNVSVHSN